MSLPRLTTQLWDPKEKFIIIITFFLIIHQHFVQFLPIQRKLLNFKYHRVLKYYLLDCFCEYLWHSKVSYHIHYCPAFRVCNMRRNKILSHIFPKICTFNHKFECYHTSHHLFSENSVALFPGASNSLNSQVNYAKHKYKPIPQKQLFQFIIKTII